MSYMPKSKSDVHITPNRVFEIIDARWHYKKHEMFDPCPMNPKRDALSIHWKDINFVNPPYGDGTRDENGDTLLSRFVYKAIRESQLGHKSIMLLPSKTDQGWFHSLIMNNYEIQWIRHRVRFNMRKCCFGECLNTRPALSGSTQAHFLVMIK
jgi:hypothetical protein